MSINEKLKRINNEDLIWLLYLFISISALISNKYEKEFILNKNLKAQKNFKIINIAIFCLAFFIYLYFFLLNYQDVSELKKNFNKKNGIIRHLALISAILFLAGGIVNILVEISSTEDLNDLNIL